MRNFISIILLLLTLLLCTEAQAWWDTDWQYRKEITLNTSALTNGMTKGLTDVPVPIRLHVANFNYFFDINGDGSDIRFVAHDDKTPLNFHIERFDVLNEMAFIWVRLPEIAISDEPYSIYMYYGNINAEHAGNPARVFDINQSAVYHFGQRVGPIQDYSAFKNDAHRNGGEPTPSAIFGCGLSLQGKGNLLLPESRQLGLGGTDESTISLWVKPSASPASMTLISRFDKNHLFALELKDEVFNVALYDAKGVEVKQSSPGIRIISGNWYHVAITTKVGSATLFLNGEAKSTLQGGIPDIAGAWMVGKKAGKNNIDTDSFNGIIDELRVSNIARSAAYLSATSRLGAPHTDVIIYGEDEEQPSEGFDTSYLIHALDSVEVSGWVVNFILLILGMLSLTVFFIKTIDLYTIDSDNKKFMAYYNDLSTRELLALARERGHLPIDKYEESTLFRIFNSAVIEVREIIEDSLHKNKNTEFKLDAQAIESIRSAMNIILVKEYERLKKRIVVMTIAISGGPFLGLLGTVIGVTMTFAVISATGDVNISSIAPGMTGALTTTIMGLLVAIPNLFAYNYLTLKTTAIYRETHAFSDKISSRFSRLGNADIAYTGS